MESVRFSNICTMEYFDHSTKSVFYVDIIYDLKEHAYDAWLYADMYGIKEHMFGLPVHNYDCGKPYTETIESVIETVEACLPNHIEYYANKHMSN